MTSRPVTDRRHRPAPDGQLRRWLLFVLPLGVVAVALAATVVNESENRSDLIEVPAPDFALPATTGEVLTLDDALADGDALVYFSMGVGCDGCFIQIPEIHDALADRGITLVSIMVDPLEALEFEAARFGIDQPILLDRDRSVSAAYGMLGQFGHGDVPSHSFAYVTADKQVERVLHYPVMFVALDDLLADLQLS
jgi:peroxiredoxin